MPIMLEVEPEVVSKIQARARELGVSVDEYLRELVDKKETESKTKVELSSQERVRLLREWASSHNTNTALKAAFANASIVGNNRVVFNIGGNKYRLVVKVNYPYRVMYVRFVGTHVQYDRINVEEI